MDERVQAYLEKNRGAAMITTNADGSAHAVRVGIVPMEGKVWSSGLPSRVRTANVRRDPRATLFVWGAGSGPESYGYLTLECRVAILEGPDVPDQSVRLFRAMQQGMPISTPGNLIWEGTERTPEEFVEVMRKEQRLIYEFEVLKAYGMY